MSTIDDLLIDIPIPRVARVRQHFPSNPLDDIERICREKLKAQEKQLEIEPGMDVAITAGSRGIANFPDVLRGIVSELRRRGANPFIVPAMGSHGGATAEGQIAVLAEMDVTEASVGAPIRSTMETVQIGETDDGLPVHVDRYASSADAIVVVNRIKPHIAFRGEFESGLLKMIAIGLGKQRGAQICHNLGFGQMEKNIVSFAKEALKKLPIICGIALLEDAYHETTRIEVLLPEEIETREPELQAIAKKLLPRLYVNELDVLVMDEIGKNIAGSGFDTNIVGRYHTPFIPRNEEDASITRLVALDLTDESHGNANGVGIVDFISRRLYEKIDTEQMYPNSLTSTVPVPVKIPMTLANDRQAIQAAIRTCNIRDAKSVRFARITNTQSIQTFELSESLLDEVDRHPAMEIISEPYDLAFDETGNLT